MSDALKGDLQQYLQQARRSVVRTLEGLSEYDVRRPLVPSGTNLLGVVKHLIGIELSYLSTCVGRTPPMTLPWVEDGSIWESADMWATADESRQYLLDLYRSACQESDASLAALSLDAPAHVSWWSEGERDTTFGHLVVRVLEDTAQHAGQCDVVREMIDGLGGSDAADIGDEEWWTTYVGKIQAAADTFRDG
jgi:uncharacterized damage-inducible protein DinB